MEASTGSTLSQKRINAIGIAMAAYNPQPDLFYLQLESIRNQTFSNWKCVICFDSKVGDVFESEPLGSFLKDSRFTILENPQRLGFKKNFERAMSEVLKLGVDAVAFADQDDAWFPNKLEALAKELAKRPPLSLVHSDMRLVQGVERRLLHNSVWEFERRHVQGQSPFQILMRNCVTGAASLFDADLGRKFGTFPDQIKFHDHWMAVCASMSGGVYPIKEPLYDYIQHQQNVVGAIRPESNSVVPPESKATLVAKARQSWLKSKAVVETLVRQGVQVPRGLRFVLLQRWDFGMILILLGIFSRKPDPHFSKACLAKGLGKLSFTFSRDELGILK